MTYSSDPVRAQAVLDNEAAARMAAWVASLLRDAPSMVILLSGPRVLQVSGTAQGIEGRLVDREFPGKTLEFARIAGPGWFLPEERAHAGRLANRLAAELRRKWELR